MGGLELFQLYLEVFFALFHLLDCPALAPFLLQLLDALGDLLDLLLDKPSLPLRREGYLLELTVPDDDGVVVAGGDAGAELLAVLRFEVLLRGDQDVRPQ